MHEYEELVYRKDQQVAGVGPWYWLKTDSGAWDGPKSDWEGHHQNKWFKHVKDWTCCVQAGSCLGMYPRLLSRIFGVVYTFEPDDLNHYVATLNCQVPNVFMFRAALGHKTGEFSAVERNHMDNVGMHKVNGSGCVPIMTVDSLQLPACGLIALDIEGYEMNAVKGMVDTLHRCSPVLVCEAPRQELVNFLGGMGYHPDEQSVSDTVFVKSS